MPKTGRLSLVAIIPAAILTLGCQSQRPIENVLSDGIEAYDEGDYTTARNDFREYTQRRPADARGHFHIGQTLLALDQPKPAAEHLWLAYDLEPAEPGYLDTLCQALYEADRTDDLYRLLTDLTTDPGHAEDYLRLGRYAARLGDADQAEPALITAVKIDKGQSPEPLVALAEFYQSVGDSENERKALIRAYHISSDDQRVNERLRALGETPGPTLATEPDGDW